MVNKLAEVEPRSSGGTVVTNEDTGEDFFRPEQLRNTFIFTSTLDKYAEISIETTHSNDEDFTESVVNEEGVPVRPGKSREVAYTDPNELIKLIVDTPTTPTSGSLVIWREKDNTPLPLDSTELKLFKELNEGRAYVTEFQESVANTGTLTAGIRNPSGSGVSIFLSGNVLNVGGDATVTTEIDHGSYTDGTAVDIINRKPELQVERPAEVSITKNPSTSSPQKTITGFRPGGTGAAAEGAEVLGPSFELNPGQDITVTITNISGASNNYGFMIDLIETVVR